VDLEEVFRAHQKEVYVYFLRTIGDRDRAEDMTGPGMHTANECAEPLNPLGVCEILKSEGRVIGKVTIDIASLGLPDEIWKV